MYKVLCLNKISPVGTKRFGEAYTFSPEMENPQGILVRSASMHDMELGEKPAGHRPGRGRGEQHPGGRPARKRALWCSTPPAPTPTL